MKLAYYIKKRSLRNDGRIADVLKRLRDGGIDVYDVMDAGGMLMPDTDVLLSFGGDGTFLSAARAAIPAGPAVIGVNLGRLGFLSENTPEDVAQALLSGEYEVEERGLVQVAIDGETPPGWSPYALNEMNVSRISAAMLGVDVVVGEDKLPTYWADGLIVATSSGSTAYSLSVGGPICTPDTSLLIIAPVSPHNLNVRPLIVPENSVISVTPHSREGDVNLTLDNRNYTIPSGTRLTVSAAPVRLRRIRTGKSDFFNALRSRLLWGMDVRNSGEPQ